MLKVKVYSLRFSSIFELWCHFDGHRHDEWGKCSKRFPAVWLHKHRNRHAVSSSTGVSDHARWLHIHWILSWLGHDDSLQVWNTQALSHAVQASPRNFAKRNTSKAPKGPRGVFEPIFLESSFLPTMRQFSLFNVVFQKWSKLQRQWSLGAPEMLGDFPNY